MAKVNLDRVSPTESRRRGRLLLDTHNHQWQCVASNEDMKTHHYVCACGVFYIETIGRVTHYSPDGVVIRNTFT